METINVRFQKHRLGFMGVAWYLWELRSELSDLTKQSIMSDWLAGKVSLMVPVADLENRWFGKLLS